MHAAALPICPSGQSLSASQDPQEARWGSLMAAGQNGDSRAYETLLREITPRVRALCRARIRDAAEAEDAVQDTLLTLHTLRHTYDPARRFGPWLSMIATRRAIDRLRRRGRGAGRESPLDDLPASVAVAETDAEARLDARRLRAAVAALPASQRIALDLAKLQDLSLAEASARSGLSIAALKVATHRALRSLRRRLGVADDAGGRDADR
jgi:RNA polymerase sigma-70 factor (ECF subfamily)